MIVLDANLLLYAVNRDAPMHDRAKEWLDTQLSAGIKTGIPWLVTIAFLRITTSRRIFQNPFSPDKSLEVLDNWLALPNVSAISPGPDHWNTLQRLILKSGTAGNLTNDAHLAAIAIEHGALLCSADNDFRRFEGLQYFNPFTADAVQEPMLAYG